jgi:hypothetical protein
MQEEKVERRDGMRRRRRREPGQLSSASASTRKEKKQSFARLCFWDMRRNVREWEVRKGMEREGSAQVKKDGRRCTVDSEHGRMVAMFHGRDWAEGRCHREQHQ